MIRYLTSDRDIVWECLEWIYEPEERVLVVGTPFDGELALELVRKGMFVTVAAPDKSVMDQIKAKGRAERLLDRLNVLVRDYMDVTFELSGFDALIAYEVLHRLGDPTAALKKCRREVRAGGRIYFRQKVICEPSEVGGRTGHLLSRALRVGRDQGAMAHAELVQLLDRFIEVKHMDLRHVISPEIVRLLERLPTRVESILDLALVLPLSVVEQLLTQRFPVLGHTICVRGLKQLDVGRVFKIRSTRPEYSR